MWGTEICNGYEKRDKHLKVHQEALEHTVGQSPNDPLVATPDQ